MNFFKDIGIQVARVWRGIKIHQKITFVSVVVVLLVFLVFFIFQATSPKYAPIYSDHRITLTDASEIKNFLDENKVPYKVKSDTLIMVPEHEIHRVRMDLAAEGIPENQSSKGFELFDSNTWIKGEKELQILEMRALKGELESDISEYDNIKSASVILDIAPPRPFGGEIYKTKASVILNLMPGARLNSAQLRSITYHVSGAVRGLQPNMVAISDTTGKLYQGLDTRGEFDILRSAEAAMEERLKSKVDGMLTMVVGYDNFYSTVQVNMRREAFTEERSISSNTTADEVLVGAYGVEEEQNHIKISSKPGKIDNISISVLIDKTITVGEDADLPEDEYFEGRRDATLLKEEVENQLTTMMEGYGLVVKPAVDFVEFNKTKIALEEIKVTDNKIENIAVKIAAVVLCIFVILGIFWTISCLFRRDKKSSGPDVDTMVKDIKRRLHRNPEYFIEVLRNWTPDFQKRALLLIALGQEWTEEVISLLKEEEVEEISSWINNMEYVPRDITEKVIKEFYTKIRGV